MRVRILLTGVTSSRSIAMRLSACLRISEVVATWFPVSGLGLPASNQSGGTSILYDAGLWQGRLSSPPMTSTTRCMFTTHACIHRVITSHDIHQLCSQLERGLLKRHVAGGVGEHEPEVNV